MTPEQRDEIRQIISEELGKFNLKDKFVFYKHSQILDGRNTQLGITTGNKYGTASTQKIGFLNATPISQQAKINDPSGGGTQDAQARTAINSIIDVLEGFGFTATS